MHCPLSRMHAYAAGQRAMDEYSFEVFFFDVCSITSNSPRVLTSGKPGAVQALISTPLTANVPFAYRTMGGYAGCDALAGMRRVGDRPPKLD
jgi:hypothetical protein